MVSLESSFFHLIFSVSLTFNITATVAATVTVFVAATVTFAVPSIVSVIVAVDFIVQNPGGVLHPPFRYVRVIVAIGCFDGASLLRPCLLTPTALLSI